MPFIRKYFISLFSLILAFATIPSKIFADDTAFGNIPTDPAGFASKFALLAIGVAGGVAFLLMIYGSFRLVFSNGDPEALQQGKQVIVAAVTGLIVVIFSVFILRLIGISILGLPI